jgi:hypothetical protein
MTIKKFSTFVLESKRYLHGEFSNFYEVITFIEDRYEYLKKMVEKYPDRREDLKSILQRWNPGLLGFANGRSFGQQLKFRCGC